MRWCFKQWLCLQKVIYLSRFVYAISSKKKNFLCPFIRMPISLFSASTTNIRDWTGKWTTLKCSQAHFTIILSSQRVQLLSVCFILMLCVYMCHLYSKIPANRVGNIYRIFHFCPFKSNGVVFNHWKTLLHDSSNDWNTHQPQIQYICACMNWLKLKSVNVNVIHVSIEMPRFILNVDMNECLIYEKKKMKKKWAV